MKITDQRRLSPILLTSVYKTESGKKNLQGPPFKTAEHETSSGCLVTDIRRVSSVLEV